MVDPTNDNAEANFDVTELKVGKLRRTCHVHLLKAANAKYAADIAKAEAQLSMLIEHGVGIGDHSNMVDDVIKAIDILDEATSRMDTVNMYIEYYTDEDQDI